MKKQVKIAYVNEKLSSWCTNIQLSNKQNYTDINRVSEGFILKLLNLVYGFQFENLNDEKSNFPGIDIGDYQNKVAVQITSRKDSAKIIDSYEKIYDRNNALNDKLIAEIFSNKILFFCMNDKEKTKFNDTTLEKIKQVSKARFSANDIINLVDLNDKIEKLFDSNIEKFDQIYKCISDYIGDLPLAKTDKQILEVLFSHFNRPAFTIAFRDECNLADFDDALKETIKLINCNVEANINDLAAVELKDAFSEVVNGLNKIRFIFSEMQKIGYATKCNCNDEECNLIFNNDHDFCWMMNNLRVLLLWFIKKKCGAHGLDFNLILDYFDFEHICKAIDASIGDAKKCVLTDEMEIIYQEFKKNNNNIGIGSK